MADHPVGLTSVAGYVPRYRLSGKSLAQVWGGGSGAERAVANYDEDALTMACEAGCREDGNLAAVCTRYCACAVRGLKAERLWTPVMRGTLDAAGDTRVRAIVSACRADPGPAPQ